MRCAPLCVSALGFALLNRYAISSAKIVVKTITTKQMVKIIATLTIINKMEDKQKKFERFDVALKYLENEKGFTNAGAMAKRVGVSPQVLSNAKQDKDRRFTDGFLKKFCAAYSDYISEDWILTGSGKMVVPDKSMKPHVEARAAAGFMAGVSEPDLWENFRPVIPDVPDYDFTIEAHGDSMYPDIQSGDTLACRLMTDRLNPPLGKICVIDSKEGAAVKIIADASDDDITLHSLNPQYPDYNIAAAEIISVAEVVALTRRL